MASRSAAARDQSRIAWRQAVIEVANQHGAPLLPRGGGTSLTGQTVNRAVVLDFSRYMAGVLEVNREELWARVQPGLVQALTPRRLRRAQPVSGRTGAALRRLTFRLQPKHRATLSLAPGAPAPTHLGEAQDRRSKVRPWTSATRAPPCRRRLLRRRAPG